MQSGRRRWAPSTADGKRVVSTGAGVLEVPESMAHPYSFLAEGTQQKVTLLIGLTLGFAHCSACTRLST